MLALILSANRDLRSAIGAVLEQENWSVDHMHPQDFEPYTEALDLLIVAPEGDEGELSDIACDDSLAKAPLLWVGNEPPPGLGASLVRITRMEVLTKLPNMLQRAELGVPLAPTRSAAPAVAVVEHSVGFINPVRGPTGGQQDF